VPSRTHRGRTRAYGRLVRTRPLHHPSATLLGAAPTLDGLWITAWTTVAGVLCFTLGAVPGDASTSRRSARHMSERAARAAGREQLASHWATYSADRAKPARRSAPARPRLPLRRDDRVLLDAVIANEGPVAAHVAGAAARHALRGF